jgi:hypothetical protein
LNIWLFLAAVAGVIIAVAAAEQVVTLSLLVVLPQQQHIQLRLGVEAQEDSLVLAVVHQVLALYNLQLAVDVLVDFNRTHYLGVQVVALVVAMVAAHTQVVLEHLVKVATVVMVL